MGALAQVVSRGGSVHGDRGWGFKMWVVDGTRGVVSIASCPIKSSIIPAAWEWIKHVEGGEGRDEGTVIWGSGSSSSGSSSGTGLGAGLHAMGRLC